MTIKAKIHADDYTEKIIKDAMFCATKVYNGILWHLRKEFEEEGKVNISRKNLNSIMKKTSKNKWVLFYVRPAYKR
ncbi:hypothetical protein ATZ99_06250 [Thermovenabulum gondwanense]|uniref:Uncharacterized protein n=1 Tax=Thermovenabulum gondwanense TaxID=520767 RepID=A0A162MU37_9FIRM|nr:hypothetical protein ATZ99_06250 [Thermovenabulum gondwanense]